MLPEKPDNAASWRERLEQLETLPDEFFTDKTELWERLHGRLQATPRSKISRWYWLAAASLLAGFMLLLISPAKKHKGIVTSATIQQEKKTPIPQQPAGSATSTIELHPDKKLASRPRHPGKMQALPSKHVNPEASAYLMPDTSTMEALSSEIVLPAPADTLLVASHEPPRKKLKVVHINEIELPARTDFQTTSKNATAVFQIPSARLLNSTGFESGSSTSADILKIKLSPSN